MFSGTKIRFSSNSGKFAPKRTTLSVNYAQNPLNVRRCSPLEKYGLFVETARLMRLENLGIGLIAKVTGLSETEIENL